MKTREKEYLLLYTRLVSKYTRKMCKKKMENENTFPSNTFHSPYLPKWFFTPLKCSQHSFEWYFFFKFSNISYYDFLFYFRYNSLKCFYDIGTNVFTEKHLIPYINLLMGIGETVHLLNVFCLRQRQGRMEWSISLVSKLHTLDAMITISNLLFQLLLISERDNWI